MAYTCVLWQLSLDKELIEFGSYVVGETTTRTITLTNVGGLGTRFKFLPDSEFFEMEEPQPIMKIVSICGDHGFRSSAQSGWVGNLPVMCAQMCEPMRLSKSGGRGKCQDSLSSVRAKMSGFREDTCSLVSGAVASGWGSLKACVTQRAGALGDPEKAPWETVGLFPEYEKGLCLSQEDCAWATVNGNSLGVLLKNHHAHGLWDHLGKMI